MMHALTGSPKMKRAHTRNDARTTGSPKMMRLLTGIPKIKRALNGISKMALALRPRSGVAGRGAASVGTCGKALLASARAVAAKRHAQPRAKFTPAFVGTCVKAASEQCYWHRHAPPAAQSTPAVEPPLSSGCRRHLRKSRLRAVPSASARAAAGTIYTGSRAAAERRLSSAFAVKPP